MRWLRRFETDEDYNEVKDNLQWPTVSSIDTHIGEGEFIEDVEPLGATVTMYPDKNSYSINDDSIQATIVIAHNLTEPCNIELSCEDENVTLGQDTFNGAIGAVSTYLTYPLTIEDGVAGSKTFEVTAEISSADQTIEEDAELLVDTIQPRVIPITITAGSNSKTYDGTTLTCNTYSVTSGQLLDGHHIASATMNSTIINAGSVSNTISNAIIRDASNANVTNYYEITYVPGVLEVTRREVTLTSASDEKSYDGTSLTNHDITVGGDGFAQGEGATYSVTGRQVLVGRSDNAFNYTLNLGTLAENYTFTKVEGLLEVTDEDVPDELVVTISEYGEPHNHYYYVLGETITVQIEATNIYEGAQTISLQTNEGLIPAQSVFENRNGGDTITTTATCVVYESDILRGTYNASVTATVGNISKDADCDIDTIAAPNGHLTVEKTTDYDNHPPANGETYDLGEDIYYNITLTNDGNLTITGITVTDELTGDEWNKASLAPEQSEYFSTTYTDVTEDDILNGEVVNVVTATGTSPDPDEPDVPVDEGIDPEPTVDPNGELTVEVTVNSIPNRPVAGDTITWDVTTTNTGNLTIIGVQTSSNYGGPWSENSLAPGASQTYTASHTLTQAEVNSGSITCTGTATGTSPDPEAPDATVIPGSSSPVWELV